MREKKRYIVFRIHSEQPVPYHSLKSAIIDSLLEFLGENDFAKAKPRLIKNLCNGKEGFLQTSPKWVDPCKFALALVHQVADQKIIIQTIKVAGTIKSGKLALIANKKFP
ncbi:MAG: hypothetical protein ISS93_02235 [Candidatus Aenigmarchaeota archaeon]|nr:hypothetical protein [Candidatus Aenigmarchaeota archaeon]